MCNPAIVAVAAAAVSAAGQLQAGQAQKQMASYNAQVAEQSAQYNADRQQDRARRAQAMARVNISKSGLDVSDSPLDVLTDSAMEAELDRLAIIRGGEAQARLARTQGAQAQRGAMFGAATTLLSAAGRAWGQMSSPSPAQSPSYDYRVGQPIGLY